MTSGNKRRSDSLMNSSFVMELSNFGENVNEYVQFDESSCNYDDYEDYDDEERQFYDKHNNDCCCCPTGSYKKNTKRSSILLSFLLLAIAAIGFSNTLKYDKIQQPQSLIRTLKDENYDELGVLLSSQQEQQQNVEKVPHDNQDYGRKKKYEGYEESRLVGVVSKVSHDEMNNDKKASIHDIIFHDKILSLVEEPQSNTTNNNSDTNDVFRFIPQSNKESFQ